VGRKKATSAHWIYFPGQEVFGRLHEPKNWSPLMAPPEKTGICLEIFCNKGDDFWKSSDETLMRMVKKSLVLFKDEEIEDYVIKRIENAYPIYGVDFERNVSIIIDYLVRYKNLYLAGRTGTFKYLNMDDCIEEGMRVSLAINNQQ
jgi:protoporphyrinogen oxidase